MENIVKRIIEIDKSAQLKLEKACVKRDEILAENKVQCDKLQSTLKSDADRALFKYSEYRKNEYAEKSSALRAVYEEKVTPVQKLEEHIYCGQCGEDLTWKDISKHQLASKYKTIINGKEWTMYKCSSTYGKYIWVTYYEKEKTLIRAAYDEEVFTGRYICECGAVK